MNVLVIAAHPDDEVLGCGGTIARLTAQGERVHIAILGEGVTSRFSKREDADAAAIAELRDRAKRVAAHLGAASLEMFGLPDNRFDSVPLLDIVKVIEGLVERHRPEVVFTQHGGDLNIDHVQTFRATLTATRPLRECPVRRVYAYEVPSSTEWAFQQFEPRLQANVFVDVTESLERKIAGMQMYDGETREFPHPRSPEALRSVATRWGTVVGCHAAEAFALVRSVNAAGNTVI